MTQSTVTPTANSVLEKALHTKVEIINKNIIFYNKLYLIFKGIGLFINDGYFSEIYNNFSYKKQIYFSGLTKETAKSILKTFTPISHKLYVDSIINNYKKYYRIRLYPHFLFYKYLYNIIYNKMRTRFLRSLEPHHKVWLLSGIIDGDGYIGKKYISISYKKNSIKGKIIEDILLILEKNNIIHLGTYYEAPKYERLFTVNERWIALLSYAIFIQYKRKRMAEIAINKMRSNICRLGKYFNIIINNLIGFYIDKRKGSRSPILVLYLKLTPQVLEIPGLIKRKDGRGMLKITRKCLTEFKNYKNINYKLLKLIKNLLKE